MATYAIVFATASKMIRRVITDDDGVVSVGTMPDGTTPAVVCQHQLSGKPTSFHPLAAGESAIQVIPASALQPDKPTRWPTLVQAATGVTPPVITCALIDGTNTVKHIINADPAVDAAPAGFTMVQCYSPLITVGCTFSAATGLFTIPATSIAAGAPGNKQGATPLPVPATVIPLP